LSIVRREHYIPGLATVPAALPFVHQPMSSTTPSLVVGTVVVLAQKEAPPEFLRTLVSTLPIALVLLAAYFLLFRPEREKARRQQDLLATLKKNDRVVTASGIYGTVANVDRDAGRVTLKIDETARMTVTLASIAGIVGDRVGDAEAKGPPRDEA
jgi:preprotein translocase subunit YajC